jgi:plasmid stabilization system protein ParE
MSAAFQFTSQATEDLDAIWWYIAEENRDAAERVELEIVATCGRLARHPRIGTKRRRCRCVSGQSQNFPTT